jgi:hypothetical protein
MYVCVCVCECRYARGCVYVGVCVCAGVCMYVCMYVCVCVCECRYARGVGTEVVTCVGNYFVHRKYYLHNNYSDAWTCANHNGACRLRLVSIPDCNLLQEQIVLKCLRLNSAPCVQYGLFGKVNVSRNPCWVTEHAVEYLPVACGVGNYFARRKYYSFLVLFEV